MLAYSDVQHFDLSNPPCCDVRCDLRLKTMYGSSHLQLFVRVRMSYLRYLCFFAYSGVQHIVCCVFSFVFFMICPRLVSSVHNVACFSGLSILGCHFGLL